MELSVTHRHVDLADGRLQLDFERHVRARVAGQLGRRDQVSSSSGAGRRVQPLGMVCSTEMPTRTISGGVVGVTGCSGVLLFFLPAAFGAGLSVVVAMGAP